MRDEALMRKALALAARGAGNTSPNPMVGAIVAGGDGQPIASGYHGRAGSAHAEAIALERAGAAARDATLYVTLEPCDHHGRTPPCTQAILDAHVARVVIAVGDDDVRARGAGIQRLRTAGVRVDVGVCEDEARRLNRKYFHQRRTGRPFVTLKMAQSLDGAVGRNPRERVKLTGARADAYVRTLRYVHDAILVGVETAIVDDPQLTVRPHRKREVPYTRIVVDSNARLPLGLKLVADQTRAATVVAVTERAPLSRVEALRARGIDVLACAADEGGRVDLRDLLEKLGGRGMLGVLCEGGPTLGAALFEANLVNELQLIAAPIIMGTAAIAPVLAGLTKSVELRIESVRPLGDDALIVATCDVS